MKRVIAVGLFVNAVLLAGILLKEEVAVHAAGGGGAPAGNGDVDGNGDYDVTDAIYYLKWRFFGGPAPVAIDCPPPPAGGLPATGETKCYDSDGTEIDCGSLDFPGQDGFYRKGCAGNERFADNGDGTVTDTCTGLQWQKVTMDIDESGTIGDEDLVVWQDALKYCENLDLADRSDWRLPNERELLSIVDYGRSVPAIDSKFGAEADFYWSSSSYADDPYYAWIVDFYDGYADSYVRDIENFVRAVRG